MGRGEWEERDSYGPPDKFIHGSSLCLLGGPSARLSKAVLVFVCLPEPSVFVHVCV